MTQRSRVQKGQHTRQQIIAVAAPIFNSQGFSGTSIQDILRQTGLEKGGLYNHFKSKDELALEAFDQAISLLREAHFEAQQGKTTALERLNAVYAVTVRSAMGEILPGGCPVMNVSVDADDTHPELLAKAQQAALKLQKFMASILQAGVEAGELGDTLDVEATARLLFAFFEGGILLTRLHRNPQPLEDVRRHVLQMLQLADSGGTP